MSLIRLVPLDAVIQYMTGTKRMDVSDGAFGASMVCADLNKESN